MSFVWLQMVNVISTFCGTGGSSLGYKWAGFEELLAIDNDSHAVKCFKLNFADVPCWHKSVIDVTGQEILDFCKIQRGDLDVLDGSPPCQGFSTAGKRQVNDPRNDLFMHFVRLVDELYPKVFVMENVTGMAKGKMKGRFIEIMQTLKGLPYRVKCKQMNSMYYGVPQSRERLIFIGVRNDLNKIPKFPTPTNTIITAKQAIGKLEGIIKSNSIYCKWAKHLKVGEKSGSKANFPTKERDIFRIWPNKPIPTITKKSQNQLIHYYEDRPLSYLELQICCSFPESFKIPSKQNERLGNAVMPKFMQAIAETIKNDILNNVSVSETELDPE